jgi:hypothetical protein
MIAKANVASKPKGLLLGPDIYSMTYFGFMKDDQYDRHVIESYRETAFRQDDFKNCFEVADEEKNMEKVVDLLRLERNSKNFQKS